MKLAAFSGGTRLSWSAVPTIEQSLAAEIAGHKDSTVVRRLGSLRARADSSWVMGWSSFESLSQEDSAGTLGGSLGACPGGTMAACTSFVDFDGQHTDESLRCVFVILFTRGNKPR